MRKKSALFLVYLAVISGFCLYQFKMQDQSMKYVMPYTHTWQFFSENPDSEKSEKIDIQHMTVSELSRLPGISRSLSQQMIDYRKENGGFQAISDLMTAGMPEKLYNCLESYFYIPENETSSGQKSRKKQETTPTETIEAIEAIEQSSPASDSENPDISEIPEIPEISEFFEISFPLELNQASFEELCAIPGIGEVLAQSILDYRENHNGFLNCGQLLEIYGIGEVIYAEILPYVYLETEYFPEDPEPELPEIPVIHEIPTIPEDSEAPEIPVINLNTATKEELLCLPGCEDFLAEEILTLRDGEIHQFYHIYEIMLAEHVTNELFAEWQNYLIVSDDGSTQIPYIPPYAE